MPAAHDPLPVSRRAFLKHGWPTLTALFTTKRYQTVAAFVSRTDADALCEELRAADIESIVIQSSVPMPGGKITVVEVQVVQADFDAASHHIAMADRPKMPRQFSLRAVWLAVTVLCVALALVVRFGVFGSFWGTVFVLMGSFSVGTGILCFRRGRASWHWHKTTGTIVRSAIEWNGEHYSPKIKYRFQVDGQEHCDDTVSYIARQVSGSRAGHELARNTVLRYPAGLKVDVFYDPLRPAHAVLERGSKIGDAVLFVGVGLAFMAGGISFFLVLF